MKKLIQMIIAAALVFAAAIIGFNLLFDRIYDRQLTDRNIVVNRINHNITEEFALSGASPEEIIAGNTKEWNSEYGKKAPASIRYVPLRSGSDGIVNPSLKPCYGCFLFLCCVLSTPYVTDSRNDKIFILFGCSGYCSYRSRTSTHCANLSRSRLRR